MEAGPYKNFKIHQPVSFKKTTHWSLSGKCVKRYLGEPDCAALYAWLLAELKEAASASRAPATESNAVKGNLGEFIALLVARNDKYGGAGYTFALGSALTPLSGGTQPGLDILILHLDPAGVAANDCLYILEVKTTGQTNLQYASALVGDYAKLLGDTNPDTQLSARVKWLKNKLKYEHNFSKDLLDRVEALSLTLAADCEQIVLLPTLVHDRRYGDPVYTLGVVADAIHSQGWLSSNIESQSIALNRLNDCLDNLASLSPFTP